MDDATVTAIRFLIETTTLTQDEIGRRFGYSQSTISKLVASRGLTRPVPLRAQPQAPVEAGGAADRREVFTARLWRAAERRLDAVEAGMDASITGAGAGREISHLTQVLERLSDLDPAFRQEAGGDNGPRPEGRCPDSPYSSQELDDMRKRLAARLEAMVAQRLAEKAHSESLSQSRDGGWI